MATAQNKTHERDAMKRQEGKCGWRLPTRSSKQDKACNQHHGCIRPTLCGLHHHQSPANLVGCGVGPGRSHRRMEYARRHCRSITHCPVRNAFGHPSRNMEAKALLPTSTPRGGGRGPPAVSFLGFVAAVRVNRERPVVGPRCERCRSRSSSNRSRHQRTREEGGGGA